MTMPERAGPLAHPSASPEDEPAEQHAVPDRHRFGTAPFSGIGVQGPRNVSKDASSSSVD